MNGKNRKRIVKKIIVFMIQLLFVAIAFFAVIGLATLAQSIMQWIF